VYAANERRTRVQTVAPQTAAERKAADAAANKKLREELELEIRAEMEAKYGPEVKTAEVVEAPPATVAAPAPAVKGAKGGKKAAPVVVAPVVESVQPVPVVESVQPVPVVEPVPAPEQSADNPNIMDAFGEGGDDLDAAFEDAMRG
jgi:hypothetical protein